MRTRLLLIALLTFQSATQSQPVGHSGGLIGTVTTETGAAVSAFVVVFPSDNSKWSGDAAKEVTRLVATTGGRFSVTGLPPGDYRVGVVGEASSKTFPAAALFARVFQASMPVKIGDVQLGLDIVVAPAGVDFNPVGGRLTGVTVETISGRSRSGPPLPAAPGAPGQPQTLPPRPIAPGSISGRITDVAGKPIAGLEVRSLRRVVLNGVPQLASIGDLATTDADGRYRLANRQAGEYFVVALPYVTERTMPSAFATVRKAPPPEPGPDGRLVGYVLTFFPGAVADREASTVTVEASERADIDFRLARRPVFDLTGRMDGPQGPLAPATVVVTPARPIEQLAGINVRRAMTAVDGTFEISELADGQYLLSLRGAAGWAEATVTIAGGVPGPLTVTLRADRIVSGRVEFVGKTPPPVLEQPRAVPPSFSAELRPATITVGTSFSTVPIRPDGTFSTRGSGSAPLSLRARTVAPWVQVAGLVDGIDTLDIPYTGDGSTNAVIVLADRPSSVLVSVRNEIDRPETDATVILFSEDARYWISRSRRVQVVQLTPGGTATFTDVPPGKYFVLAGRDFGPNRVIGPAFIENIKSRALPIEIAAGESRAVNLKVN